MPTPLSRGTSWPLATGVATNEPDEPEAPDGNGRLEGGCPEGARVWLREQDQLQPCTVVSCADGNVLFTSDYGM
ncbi:unnamed protein product, partial [Bubo scandiacus]